MVSYRVAEVRNDFVRGTVIHVYGSWTDLAAAEKFRRQLLARNVDLYFSRQRPTVQVVTIEPARLPEVAGQ